MLSLEDTKTSLLSYGRKEKQHADEARQQATQARSMARSYAASFPPDDQTRKARVLGDAEMQAKRYEAAAALHDRRSKVALAGRLLWDSTTKSDPEIALKYQNLAAAAQQHGLIDFA